MKQSKDARETIARKRLTTILRNHGIANARTLEQKISDAGPTPQRIDPHVLTTVRNKLIEENIITIHKDKIPWYHLTSISFDSIITRFDELQNVHKQVADRKFTELVGDALEIAVYRTLLTQNHLHFFGYFSDLTAHNDSTKYLKKDPDPAINGLRIPGDYALDFLLIDKQAGAVGIEVKNIREWFYPQRQEMQDLLLKCTSINAIPVLIARRIPYITFRVMNNIGGIVHQTYNQLFPESGSVLASLAKDKRLLGYHDIRLGNQPDKRLIKFIHTNLPKALPDARIKFEKFKDIASQYGQRKIGYYTFLRLVLGNEEAEGEEIDNPDLPF